MEYKHMNTYTKLRDGSWGVRVQGTTSQGSTVVVRTKAGVATPQTIARVIWTDGEISLCSIVPTPRPSSGSVSTQQHPSSGSGSTQQHPRTGCSCGSREGLPKASDCSSCQHDEY